MFCDSKVSTNEDAWPRWLMKRFPGSGTARIYAERGGRNLGNWPTAKKILQIKCLCAFCNNGWMSKLENEVKPVIEPILDNKLQKLDVSAQSTVALWAVKTGMVLEGVDSRRPWFYTKAERQLMRTARGLPQRTSVWIAKCLNQPDVYSAAKDHRTVPGANEVRAFATTVGFGSLALQVVTIRTTVAVPGSVAVTYDVSDGPWDRVLVQVWPITLDSWVWPPSHMLAGELGLNALTERLSPKKTSRGV